MSNLNKPSMEVWQRGPVPGIPILLQPVAHAIMQSQEDVVNIMEEFPEKLLWVRPEGLASVAFHLQHLAGVLDRLFTYAGGKQLNATQFNYLELEGKERAGISAGFLVDHFSETVSHYLKVLQTIPESSLAEKRWVGRSKIESTQLGILFHAAEHTQRHIGQLLVTARFVSPDSSR